MDGKLVCSEEMQDLHKYLYNKPLYIVWIKWFKCKCCEPMNNFSNALQKYPFAFVFSMIYFFIFSLLLQLGAMKVA